MEMRQRGESRDLRYRAQIHRGVCVSLRQPHRPVSAGCRGGGQLRSRAPPSRDPPTVVLHHLLRCCPPPEAEVSLTSALQPAERDRE